MGVHSHGFYNKKLDGVHTLNFNLDLHRSFAWTVSQLWLVIKSLFLEKEIYTYHNSNAPDTNCKSIFLIEKQVFSRFLKIIGLQNVLPITFFNLVSYKISKVRFSTTTHMNI